MRKMIRQRNLLMTALIKQGWELSLQGENKSELWAEYGRKFAIRLDKKNFILYKRVEDMIEVDTLTYNRRQSQQLKRLLDKYY